MRAPARSALGALALGIVAALAVGEGLVRLAARWSPAVRDLAVPRDRREPRTFPSLAAYLASQPTQVVPHRNWFNYWNNALGLNDEEFEVPKPPGRFRILALGDSFTFGLVPYPHTVMTLLEARLRAACPGRDLDVLNFGIGGAGVRDYRAIVTLGLATYDPDLVLVNFYAGNDGPDLYREVHERSRGPDVLGASRLWTFGRNALRLWRGVHDLDAVQAPPAGPAPPGRTPRGGTPVDPRRHVSERDPALTGPIFTEAAFATIQAEEMRRFYRPEDPAVVDRAWQPVLADLEAIRAEVLRQGRRLALAVYPSALQVYPAAAGRPGRDAAAPPAVRRALGRRARSVAPQPPARRLLPARRPPVRRPHAGLRRGEPRLGGAALQAAGRALDAPGQPGRGRGRSRVPGRPGVSRRSAGAERRAALTLRGATVRRAPWAHGRDPAGSRSGASLPAPAAP